MMDLSSVSRLEEWPTEKSVFLTLDLERDYGTALEDDSYEAASEIGRLVSLLESFDVPLTCFLQTKLFETSPDAIEELASADTPVEFHAHTHTHPSRDAADISFEIPESVERICDHFSTDPMGFRFPDGSFKTGDYEVLADSGVRFSSSIFPTVRPGRFNNLRDPKTPFLHQPSNIIEFPFTVYSKYLPVPVSLSYLKLLGAPFQHLLYSNPPNQIVFDFHMHDIVTPPAFERLSRMYRTVYRRNRDSGLEYFSTFVSKLLDAGYSFHTMGDLYREVNDDFD